jgi:hypothetical protein
MMNAAATDFPAGDFRVSDADRDRALSELSEAFRVGRITTEEFRQRSGQALDARTASELTALLADLPVAPAAPAAVLKPTHRVMAARITMGASAVTATALTAVAATNLFSHGPSLAQREFARQVAQETLHHLGISASVPLAPSPGFDWAGTITPVVFAILLVLVIACLHRTRADRR